MPILLFHSILSEYENSKNNFSWRHHFGTLFLSCASAALLSILIAIDLSRVKRESSRVESSKARVKDGND